MREEYQREDLGKGVRGKYFDRYSQGTNLVLLSDDVAAAFPTAESVNEALRGLIALAKRASAAGVRPKRRRPAEV